MSVIVNPGEFGAVNPAQTSSGGPFQLSDVAGLVWLPDPDDPGVILNSGEVQTLPDSTTPSEDATQGTAANQPTFVDSDAAANNRSTVNFVSANGDFLTAGDVHDPLSQSFSLFVPLRANSDTLGRMVDKRGAGSSGTQAGFFARYDGEDASGDSLFNMAIDDGGGNSITGSSAAAGVSILDGSMHLAESHWDASAKNLLAYIDRVQIDDKTNASMGSIDTTRSLVLGCAWDDASTQSQHFDGWIGKVALYLRSASIGPVSGADLTKVRDFYSSLYGTP